MHVPDELIDALTRADETLKAELEPREAGNRAWVVLAMLTDPPPGRGETPGKHPGPPLYALHRFECPRSVLEDDYLHDHDYFVHTERHRTEDIAEAFEKAAEYEPDWSKWGTRKMHPDCP